MNSSIRIRALLALASAAAAISCGQSGSTAQWLTMPTPATHDKWFPIAKGQHALDCNSCHGTTDTFKAFDCIGCHTQAPTTQFHTSVTGYQWASPNCYACHPRGVGTMTPALHAAYFPIGSGQSHEVGGASVTGCTNCHYQFGTPNIDCTACHQQNTTSGTPGPSVPADQNTAHLGKVGVTPANLWSGTGPVGTGSGETANCLMCHAADGRQGGFVATHGQASTATGNQVFPVGATSGGHFASCEQCHTAQITDPNRKNPESDFTRASCDACHAASGTSSIVTDHTAFGVTLPSAYTAGDPNNSTACLSCHQTGQFATNFSHPWFPITTTDVHNSGVAKCADCHSTSASYQGTPSANLALITCTKCHNDTAANVSFQNGVTLTAAHQAARVGKDIWDVNGGMNYTDNTLCVRCHAGNVPATTFTTPLVIRLKQHDTHCSASGNMSIASGTTHNVNKNADNGTVMCFACHNATLGTGDTPWAADWVNGPPPTSPQSCTACHEHQSNPAPRVTCQ